MNKIWKIAIFLTLLIFGVGGIIYNQSSNIKEDVFVVSKAEQINKDNDVKEVNYDLKDNNLKKNITIFISGEVKNPGVVTIESDKRLSDAVNKLGGVTNEADLNRINLAIKIKDEQHYIVPKVGENIVANSETNQIVNQVENAKININLATVEELDKLPGVGEATANKIISYREEKGKFKSIEEIKNVNGIGDKKYKDLKDKIDLD
ncbi:DUF655 domain-containing protein [Romboutsia sp.]|uniref:DUF655 domain-containing protein n=1 Tax=Romboutsia sp. TaxID=1965302 RepID=UPI003F380425